MVGVWAVHGPLGVRHAQGVGSLVTDSWSGRHGRAWRQGQRPCETWSTTELVATASCAASPSKPEGGRWSPPGSPAPLMGRRLPCPGCPAGQGTQERGSGCLWMLRACPRSWGL